MKKKAAFSQHGMQQTIIIIVVKETEFRARIFRLDKHSLTREAFDEVVTGSRAPVPFFPLPAEVQNARAVHFFPPLAGSGSGAVEYGILKLYQGSLARKDVFFHRSSLYLWGVSLAKTDLCQIFKVKEQVCVRISFLLIVFSRFRRATASSAR